MSGTHIRNVDVESARYDPAALSGGIPSSDKSKRKNEVRGARSPIERDYSFHSRDSDGASGWNHELAPSDRSGEDAFAMGVQPQHEH